MESLPASEPLLPEASELYSLGRTSIPGSRATHIEADFSTVWDESRLPEKIDVIIHLTQSANFRGFPVAASEVFEVNTVSTMKLAAYAYRAGARKFIFASSTDKTIHWYLLSPINLEKS